MALSLEEWYIKWYMFFNLQYKSYNKNIMYSVYIYKLKESVYKFDGRISQRKAGRSFNGKCSEEGLILDVDYDLPALYVGITSSSVEDRIAEHLKGINSGFGWIKKHGQENGLFVEEMGKISNNGNISDKIEELETGYNLMKKGYLVYGPSLNDIKDKWERTRWIRKKIADYNN